MASKLDQAASEAVKVIAAAAQEATKTIANAAAEASKVAGAANGSDHDTLISFRAETISELKNVRDDIQKLTDGTSKQISDHEARIGRLETGKTVQTVTMSIGIGILTLLTSILIYHLTK